MKDNIFSVILFFFLTLFQTSFMVHFRFFGFMFNLSLILVIFINLFERPERNFGLISAFWAGIFWDIFSPGSGIFGIYTLICLTTACFIKFLLRKYVQIPIIKKI